jgi:hypothetical protein
MYSSSLFISLLSQGVNANLTLILDENGVGLEAALLNFGAWMQPGKTATLYCRLPCTDRKGCNISDCYDSYNGFGDNNPLFNPTYDLNAIAGRAWMWLQWMNPWGTGKRS